MVELSRHRRQREAAIVRRGTCHAPSARPDMLASSCVVCASAHTGLSASALHLDVHVYVLRETWSRRDSARSPVQALEVGTLDAVTRVLIDRSACQVEPSPVLARSCPGASTPTPRPRDPLTTLSSRIVGGPVVVSLWAVSPLCAPGRLLLDLTTTPSIYSAAFHHELDHLVSDVQTYIPHFLEDELAVSASSRRGWLGVPYHLLDHLIRVFRACTHRLFGNRVLQ